MNNREVILKEGDTQLTPWQFIFILFGSTVAIYVLNLPDKVGKIAYQDAWISVAIGGIYPLYMILMLYFLCKFSPNENILLQSKKIFGKYLGSALNFIFLLYFFYITFILLNEFTSLLRNFPVNFLDAGKVAFIVIVIAVYTASNGIKILAKICSVTFFLTIIILFSAYKGLTLGSILNIYPILQCDTYSLLKGSFESLDSYIGLEVIFLIYPFVKDKRKIIRLSIFVVVLTIFLYVWVAFITIFYLTPDIVIKSKWSFLLVTESVTVSIINNFRFIFIYIWSLVVIKSISLFYFSSSFIIYDFYNKISFKKLSYYLLPLLGIAIYIYGNDAIKNEEITSFIIKLFSIFNIAYITLVTTFVCFKEIKGKGSIK